MSSFNLLYVLINSLILLHHGKEFLKLPHPLWLHLTSIQGFTICFQPVQHIMFLKLILRRISMIGVDKLYHLIISCIPLSFLIHNSSPLQLLALQLLVQPSYLLLLTSYIISPVPLSPPYIISPTSLFKKSSRLTPPVPTTNERFGP